MSQPHDNSGAGPPPSSEADARLAVAAAFVASLASNDRWDAVDPVPEYPWQVKHSLTNRYSTLHGGCIATIIDCLTTAAIITVGDFSGVSQDLSVSYLIAIPVGTLVRVDARVLKTGRTTAVCTADLFLEDGRLAATGRHTKHLPGTRIPSKMLYQVVDADGFSVDVQGGAHRVWLDADRTYLMVRIAQSTHPKDPWPRLFMRKVCAAAAAFIYGFVEALDGDASYVRKGPLPGAWLTRLVRNDTEPAIP